MSQLYEFYRYAAPGERQIKYHHGSRQQQACYLPGVELRTCAAARLRAITAGNSHIYQTGSQNIAHYNLADRLGSLSGVVDDQGILVSRETWYPFGGTANWLTGAQAGAALKFRRYVGKERDATGLIFYGWRYFAPWKMRWLNCDPAGTLDGLNLFCMVRNNPLTLCDQDGRVGEEAPLNLSMTSPDWVGGNAALNPPNPVWEKADMALPPIKRYLKVHAAALQPQVEETPITPPPPIVTSGTQARADSPQPGPSTDPQGKQNASWCYLCNPPRFIGSYDQRSRHRMVQHNIAITCQYAGCNNKFYKVQHYKNHWNAHCGTKLFVCELAGCARRFVSQGQLINHRYTHDLSGQYSCEKCGIKYKNIRTLTKHNKKFHGINENPLPCKVSGCNTVSYILAEYKKHAKSHLPHARH